MNGDGIINIQDVAEVLDISSGLNASGANVAIRNSTASDPFTTKHFNVSSGTDLTLEAYALGDFNNTYIDII